MYDRVAGHGSRWSMPCSSDPASSAVPQDMSSDRRTTSVAGAVPVRLCASTKGNSRTAIPPDALIDHAEPARKTRNRNYPGAAPAHYHQGRQTYAGPCAVDPPITGSSMQPDFGSPSVLREAAHDSREAIGR